jgi:hypothetical protein
VPDEFPKFAALPFVAIDDDVIAGMPVRCISEHAAIVCAERLLTVFGNAGSVALRRSNASSEKLDVLRMFGDVPNEEELAGSRLASAGRQLNAVADAGR